MSRRPLSFVKERKTRTGGLKNNKTLKEGVFHKVPIPLTGKRWVIFQVVSDEQFQEATVRPEQLPLLSNRDPRKNARVNLPGDAGPRQQSHAKA
jgi:hypothetical protein